MNIGREVTLWLVIERNKEACAFFNLFISYQQYFSESQYDTRSWNLSVCKYFIKADNAIRPTKSSEGVNDVSCHSQLYLRYLLVNHTDQWLIATGHSAKPWWLEYLMSPLCFFSISLISAYLLYMIPLHRKTWQVLQFLIIPSVTRILYFHWLREAFRPIHLIFISQKGSILMFSRAMAPTPQMEYFPELRW